MMPGFKYQADEKIINRITNDYMYHPPKADQTERYVRMRDFAKEFAILIVACTPPSREQSVALTHLDEVVMNANAAIARNE